MANVGQSVIARQSQLWLFPGEWYSSIPEGFEIIDINGAAESFLSGRSDDDIRFGCLPYGIVVKRA